MFGFVIDIAQLAGTICGYIQIKIQKASPAKRI
jgi:hypothetical protein